GQTFRDKGALKCGKTRSFLTESAYRGEALKDRSEGSWRSGRRRSGDVGGGGTVNVLLCIPCRAGSLLSTRCATNSVTSALRRVKDDSETRRSSLSRPCESSCREWSRQSIT